MKENTVAYFVGDLSANGGTERVTTTLVNYLSQSKNVVLVSLENTGEPFYELDGKVRLFYINGFSCDNSSLYSGSKSLLKRFINDSMYILKTVRKVKSFFICNNISLAVSTDTKMALLLRLAALGTRTKIVAMEHFAYSVPSRIIRVIRFILYRFVDAIVILTKEDLNSYLKINRRVFTIPNIVAFEPVADPDLDSKRVIAVGRLTYQKGFDLLIDAWAGVESFVTDWHLDIFGEGEDYELLANKIRQKKLLRVRINPFAKQIENEYQKSSIFVLSSRFEGLGMVLIEALASGVPCVSFACPVGPSTIIKDEVNGLLVNPGDVNELTQKLLELMNNPKHIGRLARNAKESVKQYSSQSVVEKWFLLFNELNK